MYRPHTNPWPASKCLTNRRGRLARKPFHSTTAVLLHSNGTEVVERLMDSNLPHFIGNRVWAGRSRQSTVVLSKSLRYPCGVDIPTTTYLSRAQRQQVNLTDQRISGRIPWTLGVTEGEYVPWPSDESNHSHGLSSIPTTGSRNERTHTTIPFHRNDRRPDRRRLVRVQCSNLLSSPNDTRGEGGRCADL